MQESVSMNARFMDTLSCIHGHTFLHSWTHFLAFMEWADDIGSGLLHGAALLSNLPLVLFVSFIGPQQLERTPIKPRNTMIRQHKTSVKLFYSIQSVLTKLF